MEQTFQKIQEKDNSVVVFILVRSKLALIAAPFIEAFITCDCGFEIIFIFMMSRAQNKDKLMVFA